ncbi:FMN-linked oxidoreductase [Cylindrobasidium torrendii FP15055 ss-10]|uniref:tRNA-dihydrouridine synthase n=1 Tax=Cylindrobasidium torrendii FP15055 ss-10 TaxID=1314674 RepID=A0A0D7B3D2_9AGAR|nr:FMN-linked oxidoreductase [Cylindrobasidium torrendii FP15055 ss-10]
MVKQSDLPFRTLTHRYGATLTYTQMLQPEELVNNGDYLDFHLRDLQSRPKEHKVVVQLCGNDVETVVSGAKKIAGYCDGVDLNLGCPQDAAREGHYGAYLLGEKDWPVVENIVVSALSHSLPVPVSAKIRLCQPLDRTPILGQRLEAAGAAWLTLHARTVSARRRRAGSADLAQVALLKSTVSTPVISNGNVRNHADIQANLDFTGADGIMVGEPLLGNPQLFSCSAPEHPDPIAVALEYLDICREYEETVTIGMVQTHVRHFVEQHSFARRPWYQKSFRPALAACKDIDAVEHLLRVKVHRWAGRKPHTKDGQGSGEIDSLVVGLEGIELF